MKSPWREERVASQIGPDVQVIRDSGTAALQYPKSQVRLMTGKGFLLPGTMVFRACYGTSWAEVTCGDGRPKSEDEKRRLRTKLGRSCQEVKEPAQHYACSGPNLNSQCSHSQISHRVRFTHINTGAPVLQKFPKRKQRTNGNGETKKQSQSYTNTRDLRRRGSTGRPLGYLVAQTDVTDAKEIAKPKCQGLFCDTAPPSNWFPSDVVNIWKKVFRTRGWSPGRYLGF